MSKVILTLEAGPSSPRFLALSLCFLPSVLDHWSFQKKQRTRKGKIQQAFQAFAYVSVCICVCMCVVCVCSCVVCVCACNIRDVKGHATQVLRAPESFGYEDSTFLILHNRGFKSPCRNIWARTARTWAPPKGILAQIMHHGAQECWAGRAMSLQVVTQIHLAQGPLKFKCGYQISRRMLLIPNSSQRSAGKERFLDSLEPYKVI